MKDRAMQALWKLALDPIAECTSDPNSYGFKNCRSTADAIEQCFTCLSRKTSAVWILEADIKACFDYISHQWLENNVPMDKRILNQWLKSGYMENGRKYQTKTGTPQGGIISPILANLALDGLESKLKERFPSKLKVHLIRYADDFIITCISKEILKDEIILLVKQHIGERGLELSKEKTRITHISEGFDFLGQNVRKYKDKLLIKPARKNVTNFLTDIKEVIKKNQFAHPINLVWQLNSKIRGWANFHRHVVSKKIFGQVDFEITKTIWKWARKRHPTKSRKWVKQRYFYRTEKGRDWCFFGKRDGKKATLTKAMDVRIKRHIKIKGNANPYDPEWKMYFERRLEKETIEKLRYRSRIYDLWHQQNGICPVCREHITEESGWHKHHIIWRTDGGRDTNENLVLLHPNCHRQVHSQKWKVGKLGLEKGP
jgi:RNA-directed DNA polymerase